MTMIRIMQIGNLVVGGNFDNPQRGRIYDPKGCAPALDTQGGGNREIKVLIQYGDPIKF